MGVLEPDDADQRSRLTAAVQAGAGISGAVGGTGVALLVGGALGGPIGAMLGGGAGWAVSQLVEGGGEVASRVLSRRSTMRLGAVFRLVDEEVTVRLNRGDTRMELLEEVTPGRTRGAELVEAVFLGAASAYEERKIRHLAHLLSGLVFETDVKADYANQLVVMANALTYRQLLMLQVFVSRQPYEGLAEFIGEASNAEEHDEERLAARADTLELLQRGLLCMSRQRVPHLDPYHSLGDDRDFKPMPSTPGEVSPRDTWATPVGTRLARLMRLEEADQGDLHTLALDPLQRRTQR